MDEAQALSSSGVAILSVLSVLKSLGGGRG